MICWNNVNFIENFLPNFGYGFCFRRTCCAFLPQLLYVDVESIRKTCCQSWLCCICFQSSAFKEWFKWTICAHALLNRRSFSISLNLLLKLLICTIAFMIVVASTKELKHVLMILCRNDRSFSDNLKFRINRVKR